MIKTFRLSKREPNILIRESDVLIRAVPWLRVGLAMGCGSITDRDKKFFSNASRRVQGPSQPLIQLVSGGKVKCPGRKADHYSFYCAVGKNEWSYTSIRPHALIDSFTFFN